MWWDKDTEVVLVAKQGAPGCFWVVCVGCTGSLREDGSTNSRVFWDLMRSSRVDRRAFGLVRFSNRLWKRE